MTKVLVSGVGTSRGTPDVAIIRIEVKNETKEQLDCRRENNVACESVVATLKQVVEENDIYAIPAHVYPQHKHGFIGTRVIGYKATNTITATVRKLELAQELVQQLNSIDEELIQVSSFQFDIEDKEKLENLARRAAFVNAKSRAAVYGEQIGFPVGSVKAIEENLSYAGTARYPSGKFSSSLWQQASGSGVIQPDGIHSISLKDSNDFVSLGDDDFWIPQRGEEETFQMGHIEVKITVNVCFELKE